MSREDPMDQPPPPPQQLPASTRGNSLLDLCAYHTSGYTEDEAEALLTYYEASHLPGYFDLADLLAAHPGLGTAGALRRRAGELHAWHQALRTLMADPRLENTRRRTAACPDGPPPDPTHSPYAQAVANCLTSLVGNYHRHRHGFEYAVTAWALGLRTPDAYPPDTRHPDLDAKSLKLWD
ncbi:hypothetical protein ACIQNG_25550 [Streptomyces sp. NPDC091377]|uniref:hypothetical protein n=1 Tax=Streptomyces sp. NPDC091377 TaxID=3365995 RepID=UPI003808FB68